MTDDLNTQMSDQAVFWPTFLVFAALLIGTYVVTAPPGGNVIQALFAHPGSVTVVGALKSALLGA